MKCMKSFSTQVSSPLSSDHIQPHELDELGRMTCQGVKYMEKDNSVLILIFAYTLKEKKLS